MLHHVLGNGAASVHLKPPLGKARSRCAASIIAGNARTSREIEPSEVSTSLVRTAARPRPSRRNLSGDPGLAGPARRDLRAARGLALPSTAASPTRASPPWSGRPVRGHTGPPDLVKPRARAVTRLAWLVSLGARAMPGGRLGRALRPGGGQRPGLRPADLRGAPQHSQVKEAVSPPAQCLPAGGNQFRPRGGRRAPAARVRLRCRLLLCAASS